MVSEGFAPVSGCSSQLQGRSACFLPSCILRHPAVWCFPWWVWGRAQKCTSSQRCAVAGSCCLPPNAVLHLCFNLPQNRCPVLGESLISLVFFLLNKYSKCNKEKMRKHSVAGDGLGSVVGRHLESLSPLCAGSWQWERGVCGG